MVTISSIISFILALGSVLTGLDCKVKSHTDSTFLQTLTCDCGQGNQDASETQDIRAAFQRYKEAKDRSGRNNFRRDDDLR